MNFSCLERNIAGFISYCEVPGIAALPGYRRRIYMDACRAGPSHTGTELEGQLDKPLFLEKQYLRREPWDAVHEQISHWFGFAHPSHIPLGVTLLAWRRG